MWNYHTAESSSDRLEMGNEFLPFEIPGVAAVVLEGIVVFADWAFMNASAILP
jgi:hypothetical protein